jgi:hypothetical protein
MSKDIQVVSSWLAEWRNDLLRGSGKDPLVHLDVASSKLLRLPEDAVFPLTLDYDNSIKKIIREEQEFSKNAGVNVLCVVHEVLHWNQGENHFVSPIALSEVQYSIDKIAQTITFSCSEERFLNPFLEKTFEQQFDQNLETWLEKNELPEHWQRKQEKVLGNFHYHRFVLLRDFDEYAQNDAVQSSPLGVFLQERTALSSESKQSADATIYPMDADQFQAFQKIVSGNDLVVEGPPGAGKSQVIANVLFHAARNNQSVVLCSEKRTALAVVAEKLKARGLGDFCQDVTNDEQAKTAFVRGLQTVWQELEKRSTNHKNQVHNESIYAQKCKALELKLERLSHFPRLTEPLKKPPFELSVYPDYQRFLTYRETLMQLNERYFLLKNANINQSAFVYLKPFVFGSVSALQSFLDALKNHQKQLLTCKNEFGEAFAFRNISDLEKLQRILLHAQILSQALFQKNQELFIENSKSFKKFHATYKKYLVSQQALELHNKQEGFKWRNPWSKQELVSAKETFSNKRFWQSDFRAWKKKFVASYQPEVFTKELAISAIDSCLSVHDVMSEYQNCLEDFQKLGILHPEVDIPLVLQLQRNVHQDYLGLKQTQEQFSSQILTKLLTQQSAIHDLNRFVHHHFTHLNDADVITVFQQILADSDFFLAQQAPIFDLLNSEPLLPKFWHEIQDFEHLDEVMKWGEIEQFKSRNPELFHYSGADLLQDVDKLIQEEDSHFDLQVALFHDRRVQAFLDYHQLITAPSNKLSVEQKTMRTQLKSGRALLIKEFNKTRQHKSMRELLSSDAAIWIRLLQPILLLNPLMISKVLPNESNAIDILVFDEASQIPFSHAIPAIFRAKQLAIFGDSQQLSPTAFFLQGSAQRSDLLTEARHFLPKAELNYHYRSRHESLIAFSNRYFYNNRLKVLPARKDDQKDGVFCHFVANGIYDSGQNPNEAAALISYLEAFISQISSQESIGIVAFSEKQMEVLNKLLLHSKKLNSVLENERITLTTLEKVQGDEFDVLLISMGYGKDESGEFALRMGPINQQGGEKRLNVLFSRARRAMHFFHSVKAPDFGVSENFGIDALKKFLLMHEERIYGETPANKVKENTSIELIDPFYSANVVSELMTLKRHADWSGLKVQVRFWKDEVKAV